MGILRWNMKEEQNLTRLQRAQKLIGLAITSNYLIDVGAGSPKTCVQAVHFLLDIAIQKTLQEKNRLR
jgi:hypothetical protein